MDGPSAVVQEGFQPSGRLIAATRSPIALGLTGKGAELATQLLLVTLVPRLLGPSDYGSLATALAVVIVGSVQDAVPSRTVPPPSMAMGCAAASAMAVTLPEAMAGPGS